MSGAQSALVNFDQGDQGGNRVKPLPILRVGLGWGCRDRIRVYCDTPQTNDPKEFANRLKGAQMEALEGVLKR